MKEISTEAIFSLFETNDEELYREYGVEGVLANPYIILSMVISGVSQYPLLDQHYALKYKEKYKDLKEPIKNKYFRKLYGYLTRLDIEDSSNHKLINKLFEDNIFGRTIDVLIKYFESIEDFEKCAVLVKYKDLLIFED